MVHQAVYKILNLVDPECPARGGKGEDGVERGSLLPQQQDPWSHEVVQGHPEGYILPAEDPEQPRGYILHQELVRYSYT